MIKSNDPRIVAIRNNKLVGRGSCTSIDECYDDSDLIRALDSEQVATPEAAVKWAVTVEEIRMERTLDARCQEEWESAKHDAGY